MTVLNQLASAMNIRSDIPNQQLAKKLADSQNREDIRELADALANKNQDIASDSIKVLYEIGYLNPDLIKDHVNAFLHALHSRNNRLVWGGMIALATIADLQPEAIFDQFDFLKQLLENGSVITIDNVVLVLAKLSAAKNEYETVIFPELVKHLNNCRSKEIPQHAEKVLGAVNLNNYQLFIDVLESRMDEMIPSQISRIKKVIKEAQKIGIDHASDGEK